MTKGSYQDLTGRRYGRLLVTERAPNQGKHLYWRCACDCGNNIVVRADALTRGTTASCGCYGREVVTKHGMYKTSIYKTWRGMLERCENQNANAYELYGGRGVKVCERWHDFELFLEDMGRKPRGKSLDRVDNDGDYEPGNCRWATAKQQGRNRSDNHKITYGGKTKCISAWAETTGMNWTTISARLKRGWTVEQTLTTPVDLGNRWKRQAKQSR